MTIPHRTSLRSVSAVVATERHRVVRSAAAKHTKFRKESVLGLRNHPISGSPA